MDGSIADSTMLRMRSQLQRTHHSAENSQSQSFVEELLKLPTVTPSQEPTDQPPDPINAVDPSAVPKKTQDDKDDEPVKDEASADEPDPSKVNPCIAVCYGPNPVAEPVAAEVEGTTEASAKATPDQQIVEPTSPLPIQDQDQTQTAPDASDKLTTDPESVINDALPASKLEVVASAQTPAVVEPTQAVSNSSKPARDAKRPKEANDKNVEVEHHTQTSSTVNSAEAKPVKRQDAEQPQKPDKPVVAEQGAATPVESDDSESSAKPRDKWYARDNDAASAADSSTLAERMSQDAQQNQDKAAGDANGQLNNNNRNDANVTATVSPISDPSAMATVNTSASALASIEAAMALAASGSTSAAASIDALSGNASSASRVEGVGSAAIGAVGGTADGAPVAGNGSSTSSGNAQSGTSTTSGGESTEGTKVARPLSQQERVRLVQRVARSFSRLGPNGGQVTLRLHPAELGVLNVSIKIEGQTMTARMQTESTAARDLILEGLPVLRDRLSEQGIEVEKFQVDVGHTDDFANGGANGQTSSSFGDGSQPGRNESSTTDIDYRRLSRGNAARQAARSPIAGVSGLAPWTSADRSLDVRA